MQLSLRTLFWLLFAAAIAIGWGWEGYQLRQVRLHNRFIYQTRVKTTAPTPSAVARHKLLDDLSLLSDAELIQACRKNASQVGDETWQVHLSELIRRKLPDEISSMSRESNSRDWTPTRSYHGQMLTAERRIAGQPDPLTIRVRVPKHDDAGKGIKEEPLVQAVLENVDINQRDAGYERGGDYRGGRPERWRIVLTDEHGRTMEDSNFASFMGGGISGFGAIKFGAQEEFTLDARTYVAPPPTGRYSLQVLHAADYIAEEPDLAGLIVWKSQPIQVQVTNPTTFDFLRYVILRFLAIVGLAVAVVVVPLFGTPTRSASEGAPRKKSKLWRDLIALAVILALATGWSYDSYQLKLANFRALPDAQSLWTMEVI